MRAILAGIVMLAMAGCELRKGSPAAASPYHRQALAWLRTNWADPEAQVTQWGKLHKTSTAQWTLQAKIRYRTPAGGPGMAVLQFDFDRGGTLYNTWQPPWGFARAD